jgi:hypothetical protein
VAVEEDNLDIEIIKPKKSVAEIRYNSILRKCKPILNTDTVDERAIPILKRTEQHLDLLLQVLGEKQVIEMEMVDGKWIDGKKV